jgi:hypothetical protein
LIHTRFTPIHANPNLHQSRPSLRHVSPRAVQTPRPTYQQSPPALHVDPHPLTGRSALSHAVYPMT